MQDIAGCRITTLLWRQNDVVAQLVELFEHCTVIDRRERPSHGYRAVHIVVNIDNKRVEIQVRTELQHSWAELCERLSDEIDPAIKYGGGPDDIQMQLAIASDATIRIERAIDIKDTTVAIAELLRLNDAYQRLNEHLR